MTAIPTGGRRRSVWLHRSLINWPDLYRWCIASAAVEVVHHDQLHTTLATVRSQVDWSLLGETRDDVITIGAGPKPMIEIGNAAHALSFGCPEMTERFEEVAWIMGVDHRDTYQPHITLGRGSSFRQPTHPYEGELVFGPEIIEPFVAGIDFARTIPINRNKYREAVGLESHDDDAAMQAEHLSRPGRHVEARKADKVRKRPPRWEAEE